MKHFLPKYLCFFFLLTLWLSVGKVLAQISYPDSITNPTGTSTSLFPPASASDIDSVTIGSTMPYYVLPDLNFNPKLQATATQYDKTKIFTKANIESSFSWPSSSTIPALPTGFVISSVSDYGSYTLSNLDNFKNITFGANTDTTSVKSLTVTETSASTYGGCSGTTTFKIQAINPPKARFTQAGGVTCPGSAGTYYTLPIAVYTNIIGHVSGTTKVEKHIAFTLTYVYNTESSKSISTFVTYYAEGNGTVNPTIQLPSSLPEGIYTFTLGNVTDRISRKCGVNGIINSYSTYKLYVTSPKPTLSTSAVK